MGRICWTLFCTWAKYQKIIFAWF